MTLFILDESTHHGPLWRRAEPTVEESRAHCAFLVSRWHEAADKTSLAPTAFRPQHVSQVNHPFVRPQHKATTIPR